MTEMTSHQIKSGTCTLFAWMEHLRRDYVFGGQSTFWYSTEYDLLGRPTNATDSVSLVREWLYNRRSELAAASIGTNLYGYAYDSIGNRLWSAENAATNTYTANSLNQYTSVAASTNLVYDADGNLTNDGIFSYSYDAENRLVAAYPLSPVVGSLAVLNRYDHKHRRVQKIVKQYDGTTWGTIEAHTFVWDGNNIVLEKVEFANGTTRTLEYFWGMDKSGTEQGAGGVGGLLAVSVDGVFYIPCYDNNGNITRYLDANGNTVAQYTYDAFGGTLSQSGSLASFFRHRFSTKYLDVETGLYYYGYRFYLPPLMRWLSRDPIGERGGLSLYAFCENDALESFDSFGENRYITQFDILNLGGSGGTQMHVGVAVDDWVCRNGKWVKVGVVTFDFGPEPTFLNMLKTVWKAKGVIDETYGLALKAPITIKSTPQQDIKMLKMIREEKKSPPFYNGAFHNCVFWSVGAINYGM